MNKTKATILKDSTDKYGNRLTTFRLTYPRIILSEFNTHRLFCLDGDCELDFDLPSGSSINSSFRRVHRMTIREFVNKWHNGAKEHIVNSFYNRDTSIIELDKIYTAKEIALLLEYKSPSNIRKACRENQLVSLNPNKFKWEDFKIKGSDFVEYYSNLEKRTFSIKNRLASMQIRQLNENTTKIQTSTVKDCWFSGNKEVFEVVAGDFTVSGSKDHRVLTQYGWKSISDLEIGVDCLICESFGKIEDDKNNPNDFKFIDGKWVQSFTKNIKLDKLKEQNFQCYDCGTDISNCSDMHYVVSIYEDKSLAFDISNIVALCQYCHKERHSKQGWQGGTYLYGVPVKIESITSIGIKDTYDLEINGEFANFLANGVVVHNSRNTSSSRAIPVKDNIERVLIDPFIPEDWVQNSKGMYSLEHVNINFVNELEEIWINASSCAREYAKKLTDNELHKEYANRLLEPFMYVDSIISATDFDNFFHLRISYDAQPEIQLLANLMYDEYINSTPTLLKYGQWHLPYIDTKFDSYDNLYYSLDNKLIDLDTAIKISVSCCGQVSYRKLNTSLEKALEIYNKFVSTDRIHACYDKDTEFLTKHGWIVASDYDGVEEIAVVVPGSHEIFFEKPFQYNIYDNIKKMVYIEGQQLDLLTTLNHRHYVSKRTSKGWQPFEIEEAGTIHNFQLSRKYLKSGHYKPIGVNYPIDLRLLGMYIGDGSEYRNNIKFHIKKQRKIDYLYSVDPNMRSLKQNTYVLSNECGNWLFHNCRTMHTNEKKLPDDFINMTLEQWILLKEGLLNSDGHFVHSSMAYSTTSKVLAEQLQILAHLHGESCSFSYTYYDNRKDLIKLTFSKRITPEVSPNQNGRTNTYSIKLVDYNDTVYCPTVSTGLVLIRRNEKVAVSGNSALEHAATPFSDDEYNLRLEIKNLAKQRLKDKITDLDLEKFLYKRNFKGWTQYRISIDNETYTHKFKKVSDMF